MEKEKFISELFKKRSVYSDEDQSEMAANLLDSISSDIYSESQRFVFELIQNADDSALGDGNEVHFDFLGDTLVISHNGQSFSEDDIKSLTSAGSSTKTSDPSKTGYKGIGFKSVFGKSERVSIFSGGYQFRFDKSYHLKRLPWQIIPIWTEENDLPEGVVYSLLKDYAVTTIIEIDIVDTLREDLLEMLFDGQILLFLRKITKISVSNNGVIEYFIQKDTISKSSTFNKVVLLKDNDKISSWIVKTFEEIPISKETRADLLKDKKTPKKLQEATFTELTFAAKIDGDFIEPLQINESLIFTYLPTKVNTFNFPFLLNGSFLTNAAREALHEDRIWNKWLMKQAGQMIIAWMELLATTEYKFEILKLLPVNNIYGGNRLRIAFFESLELNANVVSFIPTTTLKLKIPSEIIIDKTGLSRLDFLLPGAVLDFINKQVDQKFDKDSFIHPELQLAEGLNQFGAYNFDLDNLEMFFLSSEFIESHTPEQNFSLIMYFYERCLFDKVGEWKKKLVEIPFLFSVENILKKPLSVCFPSIMFETDFGATVTLIHQDVYQNIENDYKIKNWLEELGVKEPSDEAYLENEIIGNLDECVNESNYLPVTRYLFNHHKNGLLTDEHYEDLQRFKLLTTSGEFIEAAQCYLSDIYEPVLRLETVNSICKYVSSNYKQSNDLVSEWKTFFLKIGVVENVKLQRISLSSRHARERYSNFIIFFDENSTQKYNTYGGYVYHNTITEYQLTTYSLIEFAVDYDFAKLFWGVVLQKKFERVLDDYGHAIYYNSPRLKIDFFDWCISNSAIFPTTLKTCEIASEIFINDKEIMDIASKSLPVFDFSTPLSEEWKRILPFKRALTLEDCLNILSIMAEKDQDNGSLSKDGQRRIGLIYNKLQDLMPDLSAEKKETIKNWADCHSLPSRSLRFENAKELKHVNIVGFNSPSEQVKPMLLPENCRVGSPEFLELISLFKIQVINEFTPQFGAVPPVIELALKNKLLIILPYLAYISERKRFTDFENDYATMYDIITRTQFYRAAEINLTFQYEGNTIVGASLSAYAKNNRFYFKGEWRSPLTMFSLVPELASLMQVPGLNEEIRLLLELSEAEIKEYFIAQGFKIEKTIFQRQHVIFEKIPEELQGTEHNLVESTNLFSSEVGYDELPESFIPEYSPSNYDLSKVRSSKKTFVASSVSTKAKFTEIKSDSVRYDIGRWCEILVYEHLTKNENEQQITWSNEEKESGLPYDLVLMKNGTEKFIDVKGTPSNEKNIVYLSRAEWAFMLEKGKNYSIYRVYRAGYFDARIEIIENPKELLMLGKILPGIATIKWTFS